MRRASHNCATGHSTGSAIRVGCSGSEGGRRRASSVVTDFPASSNDHAARATLGRQGRPRRPGYRETVTVAVSVAVSETVPVAVSETVPVAVAVSVAVSETVPVAVTATGHAGNPLHRECRVRDCAGTTTRQCGALRTIALPGTPREGRSGSAAPARKEAAARATLGRRRRPRRPGLRVPYPRPWL